MITNFISLIIIFLHILEIVILFYFINFLNFKNLQNLSNEKKIIEEDNKKKEKKIIELINNNEKKYLLQKNELEKKNDNLKILKNTIFNELKNREALGYQKIEEIKDLLLMIFEKEIKENIKELEEREMNECKNRLKEETTKIICLSLEKYSSEIAISKTVNHIKIEKKEIINRIIGKNGRNINFFKKITGTELIINNESENSYFIQISSFNPLRRKIAEKTLNLSVEEQGFSPIQITRNFEKAKLEINHNTTEVGKKVLEELGLNNVHEELTKRIGILEYRTSFGQNVLEHSIEVAKISGNIANELGLDEFIAKRAGLFHDIGKAFSDKKEEEASHVLNGINLAKKCNENSIVINAIASHHKEYAPNNFYSLIIIAADKLSAARPGSRSHQVENYIERMGKIEEIIKKIEGVEQCYSFQAGREIWIIINSKKVDDYQTLKISQKIKRKISEEIFIPGNKINVNVIREKIISYNINLKNKDKIKTDKDAIKI